MTQSSFNVRSAMKTLIIFVELINYASSNIIFTKNKSSPIVDEISELENTSSIVVQNKNEKLPLYVKELYEIVKSENEPIKMTNRLDFNDTAPLTIQAIRQEINDVSSVDDGGGMVMKFSLKKLWISPYNMARAELVLGVRKNLIRPTSRYVVNVYASSSDDVDSKRRRSISQILDVNDDVDPEFQFLIVPFTDIVKSFIQDWRQTQIRTEMLTVRMNVDETPQGDGVGHVIQMETSKIRRLFRSTNHGHYSPLLILYSSQIGSAPFLFYERRRKRRLRRDIDEDASFSSSIATKSSTSSSSRVGFLDENCSLRSWTVDLREYFSHDIITPISAKINFCSGKCPFPAFDSHWNSTANAIIRKNFVATGVNYGGDPPIYVPDAVCVPQSYHSLTTLSRKENGLFLIESRMNMIAASCMCV